MNEGDAVRVLKDAVRVLKRGGTAILPTDTVYGICCFYRSKKGVVRIYREKKRSSSKPLPLVAGSLNQMMALLKVERKTAETLSKLPVTLKGHPKKKVPKEFLCPDGKIAVRLVGHPFTRKVALASGPLAATSANLSGKASATSAKKLKITADLVIDKGATKFRKPTTIVDIENLEVVRKGASLRKVIRLLKLIKKRGDSKEWKGKTS